MSSYGRTEAHQKLIAETKNKIRQSLGIAPDAERVIIDGVFIAIEIKLAGSDWNPRLEVDKIATKVGDTRQLRHAWAGGQGLETIVASIRARVATEAARLRKQEEDRVACKALADRHKRINNQAWPFPQRSFRYEDAAYLDAGRIGRLEFQGFETDHLTDDQKAHLLYDLEQVLDSYRKREPQKKEG